MLDSHLARIDALLKSVPADVQLALDQATVRHTFAKGDYLLRQGDVCRYSDWIESGLARKYYLIDGQEITTDIYFPGDLALSMTSYSTQTPSQEFIEVLEPVTTSRTDYEVFQVLKTSYPVLIQLDLLLTEYYALWQEERMRQFRTLDATQRYELLLTTHPDWVQCLSLTHIASYLGVSRETLSRIRAKRLPANRM
jgi:CRP-like cAMP-binding protein